MDCKSLKEDEMKILSWKLNSIILIVILMVLGAIWSKENHDQKLRQQRDYLLEKAQIEFKLTKWVYENSTLISRATCQEIVRAVMKTKYPTLMLAIIELESKKFTPGALSSKGAIGWCQVMFEDRAGKDIHGKELFKAGIIKEKRDLWDITPNIKSGEFILDQKLVKGKGDVTKALEGYLGEADGKYVLRILSTYANLNMLILRKEEGK